MEACLIQCHVLQLRLWGGGRDRGEEKTEKWAPPPLPSGILRPHLQPETSPTGMEAKTQASHVSTHILTHTRSA